MNRRLLLYPACLAVCFVLMEAFFWWWHDGAFPHVNFYVPDEVLGVRLAPGATERIRFGDNPVTQVRINAQGYRGEDFPPPRREAILVVGDSQVFGLGVEEDETFAAQLARLTGRQVINGGVPTYGPLEYNAVVTELLSSRKPSTVIYVVNFVNDLFENERPNRERHRVWDGWAVRAETAPESVLSFPGRSFLFQRSHALYAFRRFFHGLGAQLDDRGFASEGTWQDVAQRAGGAAEAHQRSEAEAKGQQAQQRAQLEEIEDQLKKLERDIDRRMLEFFPEARRGEYNIRFQAARGNPGDIVQETFAEAGRPVMLTAELIRQGTEYRGRLEARLRVGVQAPDGQRLLKKLEAREALEHTRDLLYSQPVTSQPVPSVLEPRLLEAKALCDAASAALLVVALPIDVQVSPKEWEKYGVAKPIDMASTRVLLADVVYSATRIGADGIDVTSTLEAAEPGAFLDGDIHMTSKGHAAVAEVLAARLSGPADRSRSTDR